MAEARIERLELRDVRTYEHLQLAFTPGMTVLVGSNGVGKTNLLEAIAVALSGTSPRTSSELRLVRDGATSARLAAEASLDGVRGQQHVVLKVGSGKQLCADGSVVRSVEQFAQPFPIVSFLPEKLLTVRGAPQRRRALLDSTLARLHPSTSSVQRAYAGALVQRNALLRRARSGRDIGEELTPWTQQLTRHGSELRELRAALLDRLSEPYQARFFELTGMHGGGLDLQLRGGKDMLDALEQTSSDERRRGSTLVGPHLDDLQFLVQQRDLRAFGSTGEQRAALLAFTFALRDVMFDQLDTAPVILLDEPWSELDADRRRRLSHMLGGLGQSIVTTTEPPTHLFELGSPPTILTVTSGSVQPWTDTTTPRR